MMMRNWLSKYKIPNLSFVFLVLVRCLAYENKLAQLPKHNGLRFLLTKHQNFSVSLKSDPWFKYQFSSPMAFFEWKTNVAGHWIRMVIMIGEFYKKHNLSSDSFFFANTWL